MGQVGGLRRVAGRYRLTEVLGRGGMGTVWRAEDELLGRAVAIKVIAAPDDVIDAGPLDGPEPERHVQTAGRARREARAAGRLNHPGAVTVHDIIEEDGRFHIIMELIDAPTLADLVRAEGQLSPSRVAAIGTQLLDVLDFAHAEGIVHRDVKPSNVMVLAHDRVKLTDFGIAVLRGDPQLTTSGTTLGSPMFMAPEQAAGTAVGPAADLWSLGATMYYAVEGRAPFHRETAMAVLAAILSQPPDPPQLAGPLTPALTALLVRPPESRPDGVVLRRLLAAAGSEVDPASGVGAVGEQTLGADDPEATQDLDATMDAPVSTTTMTNPVPADRAEAPFASPVIDAEAPFAEPVLDQDLPREPAVRRSDLATPDRPAAGLSKWARLRGGKVQQGLIGVLTVAVAALSFTLWQRDQDPSKPSDVTNVRQEPGGAEVANPGETGAAVAANRLAPLAPDAPSDGLGLGGAGRAGEIEQSDAGPTGQSLAKFFDSASNPVGGYAVGVPQAFDASAVGPTTFVAMQDTMFRAGFEVRSYRPVDPWARLVQDEKQFAKEHADDGYQRKKLTPRWTYRGDQASAWEFTWTLNDVLMHAREVSFRVGPRTYTVLYRSTDLWWLGGGSNTWPDGFEQSFFPSP